MRTDDNLKELCNQLQILCGDLHRACRAVGLSPAFVIRWMKDDKVAADAIEEAQRVGWLGLESEAIRRAVHGVEEDVWFKGEAVGTKTVYSDGLLAKVMEANLPKYKKGEGSQNTFNGPTQINIMPRANSYEEWLAMKDATLARREEQPALPAPREPDDADLLIGEYVEVSDQAKAAYEIMKPPERPLAGLEGLL